jgi:hypothetical protein
MTLGVSAIAAITSSVKSRGCGEVKRTRSQAIDLPARAQQLAERVPVAELHPVGVDVLPEQGDLDDPVGDREPDLREHVARPTVALGPAQGRNDAERAGVVAPDRDRHPREIRRLRRASAASREDVQRLVISTCACPRRVAL